MSANKEKLKMHTERQKTQYEEIEQASEPGMVRMLELSNQEFKTTMLNRLRTLIEKAGCNARWAI